MTDLLLHVCCAPCSTAVVPAWRGRGVEPVGWFGNPNLQPEVEHARRLEAVRRYSRAEGLELVVAAEPEGAAWRVWRSRLARATAEERCAACLGLRLDAAGAAARRLGFSRFSTTLTVSPFQRHDLIRAAGAKAAKHHRVEFVYLDARDRFRDTYAESRRLDLFRQAYCGCAASKWDAWHERRDRRRKSA